MNGEPPHRISFRATPVRALSLGLCLCLLALFLTAGPITWARPPQSSLYQTIPTRTPTPTATAEYTSTPTATATQPPSPTPSETPTEVPSATNTPTTQAAPSHTPTPPPPTPTRRPTQRPTQPPPPPTSIPTVETDIASPLQLIQSASSLAVIPGEAVTITLQVTNIGHDEIADLTVEDTLPQALILNDVSAYGSQAHIGDNEFTLFVPRLAGGQTLVIVISAQVAGDAPGGSIIEHQPVAHLSQSSWTWPVLALLLPPVELPSTGGRVDLQSAHRE